MAVIRDQADAKTFGYHLDYGVIVKDLVCDFRRKTVFPANIHQKVVQSGAVVSVGDIAFVLHPLKIDIALPGEGMPLWRDKYKLLCFESQVIDVLKVWRIHVIVAAKAEINFSGLEKIENQAGYMVGNFKGNIRVKRTELL